MGILLVYDVTNEQSFKNVEDWIKNIEKHTLHQVNTILVGQQHAFPQANQLSRNVCRNAFMPRC